MTPPRSPVGGPARVYRIEREWIRAFGDFAAGQVDLLPGRYSKRAAIAVARERTSQRHRQRVVEERTGRVVWQTAQGQGASVTRPTPKMKRRPAFTVKRVHELLDASAKGAQELHDKLQAEHIRGLERCMRIRLR